LCDSLLQVSNQSRHRYAPSIRDVHTSLNESAYAESTCNPPLHISPPERTAFFSRVWAPETSSTRTQHGTETSWGKSSCDVRTVHHRQIRQKNLLCGIRGCPKTFSKERSLIKHARSFHREKLHPRPSSSDSSSDSSASWKPSSELSKSKAKTHISIYTHPSEARICRE
jgi:hypothetical protein